MASRSRCAELFTNYLVVDWSAASVPRTGGDSIWYAWLDPRGCVTVNPPTRVRAFLEVRARLLEAVARSQRTLAAFDFPLGYPRGAGPWETMWSAITAVVEDAEDNRNNRFAAAEVLNARLGGPFWGRPGKGVRKPPPEQHGLPEMRIADAWTRGPQSPWKLYGVGSAGSQALTGLPYLQRLRQDAELGRHVKVWPFETGLRAPAEGLVILAEAWPSMLKMRSACAGVKDEAQVRALAKHFAGLDRAGALAPLFCGPAGLGPEQRAVVEREEGWILGVR